MPTDPSSSPDSRPVAPLLVDVLRGPFAESGHRGHAVVIDADGGLLAHWGEPDLSVMPRSAIKSLQALALVESGAVEAFGLSAADIALACASHGGEDKHARRAIDWLGRIGLTVADLECGAQPPMHRDSADALVAAGTSPTAAHNNCSGKHVGFLTTAVHLGIDHRGYTRHDHPIQALVRRHMQAMTDIDPDGRPWGIDGCSIPAHALPLRNIALALARLDAHGADDTTAHGRACRRIVEAWGAHPDLVAGTGRFDTRLMTAAQGRALTKAGAEGVSCAIVPGRRIAVAVKIEDGAERAASVVMAAILSALGAVDRNDPEIRSLAAPTLSNWNGISVGGLTPTAEFAESLKAAFS
ncbi:asparaginase [Fodinicurvata sp. EGI_FJ10296]|jgi:L-asparaginase II|uniref:asparaginase n=1 Tax=Fodinicurvata sp. EGI_FJ10296 TaxID=3231908 RepID=UPI0034567DF6